MSVIIQRKNKIDYIKGAIIDILDKDIKKIYELMRTSLDNPEEEKYETRQRMMMYIKNNICYVDEKNLEIIKKAITECLNPMETREEKLMRIALEIVNKTLELMGHRKIVDLTQFTDIRRDELLDDKYLNLFNENQKYIFENGFDKTECKIYQKKVRHTHISILKGMLKQIGYKLCSKNHRKMIKGEYDMYTTYSIQKDTED